MRKLCLFALILLFPIFAYSQPGSPIDLRTGARITETFEHYEVHEGDHYTFTIDSTVGDTDTLGIIIITPDTKEWAHVVFDAQGALDTHLKIFETNTEVPGNTRTAYNNDRNSTNTNTTLIKHWRRKSGADGTLIYRNHFGIDSGLGANKKIGGGGDRASQEWILKQNTQYLVALVSATAGNIVSLKISWYETTFIDQR